jgi:hypothetical protein
MVSCAAACLLACLAPGQPEPPPLSGPRLNDDAARQPALLRFDFAGRVAPTDEPPEFAALKHLDLAPATLDALAALRLERSKFLDDFVAGHIDLLVKFGSAAGAENVVDMLMLTYEAMASLRPLVEAGPLARQVRALLPAEQASRYDAALREYWAAVIATGQRTPDARGNTPPVFAIVIQSRLESFGRELEHAFRRVEQSGDFLYTYLAGDLGLTGEPAARVRELFADFAEAGGDDADERTKALLGAGVLAHLTPEQTVKLVRRIQGLMGK